MRDEVDGCRDRRSHELGIDVAPGEQGQRAELRECLARRVRVDGGGPWNAGVQRQEEVQRLGVAHLAHDEAVGPHAQRLLDEPAQRHLAGAFEARLPPLERDEVRSVDGELEGLLDGDDPVIRRAGGDERAQQGGLAGMRRAGDQDAASRAHRVPQQSRGGRRQRSGGHETVEVAERRQELADVHGPVAAGDVGDDDVQSAAVGKRCVDERLAQVDAATGGMQHPLHQIAHLRVGEGERHALGDAAAGDEDPIGGVQPHLLDRRIVEVGLQRSEAGDGGEHLADARRLVVHDAQPAGEREVVVAPHLGSRDLGRELEVARRVGALRPKPLAHTLGHQDGRRQVAGARAVGLTGASSQGGSAASGSYPQHRCRKPLPAHPALVRRWTRTHTEGSADAPHPAQPRSRRSARPATSALVLVGILQVAFAFLAAWDLAHRPAEEVRGPKPAWIPALLINWIGPASYFLFGIKR